MDKDLISRVAWALAGTVGGTPVDITEYYPMAEAAIRAVRGDRAKPKGLDPALWRF